MKKLFVVTQVVAVKGEPRPHRLEDNKPYIDLIGARFGTRRLEQDF